MTLVATARGVAGEATPAVKAGQSAFEDEGTLGQSFEYSLMEFGVLGKGRANGGATRSFVARSKPLTLVDFTRIGRPGIMKKLADSHVVTFVEQQRTLVTAKSHLASS
jgi:hypothetical protein